MCIGADTIALEVLPSEEQDVFLPVHAYMFATAGAQIMEVVDMEEIAAEKQYEFAFLGFPLKLRGATGAPMPCYAVPLQELSAFARLGLVFAVALVLASSAAAALLAAPPAYRSSVEPLPAALKQKLTGPYWRPGCPVSLEQLRLLTVTHWGFDGRPHTGQLVVNAGAAAHRSPGSSSGSTSCASRSSHMRLPEMYDRRVVARRRRRHRLVRVPAGRSLALLRRRRRHRQLVEPRLRPRGRPEPGREPVRRLRHVARQDGAAYMDRSRHRRGMVTPAVIAAFASIGWELGRQLERQHQGLHALLGQRALALWTSPLPS